MPESVTEAWGLQRDFDTSEFCEISKNTFLHRTPLAAASGPSKDVLDVFILCIFNLRSASR